MTRRSPAVDASQPLKARDPAADVASRFGAFAVSCYLATTNASGTFRHFCHFVMKPFFGRTQELIDLDATARLPGAKFVVIKGRRRVAKSRLAQEFGRRHPDMALYYLTGLPPTDPPSAVAERENFASQLSRVFKIPKPTSDNWDELLWHLADRVKGGNAILILDEINWMGHADAQFSSRLWGLWETELSGLSNFILILSGSLAGWIDNQFSSHTGYLGRISWNLSLEELPAHDALRFFGARRSRISIHQTSSRETSAFRPRR